MRVTFAEARRPAVRAAPAAAGAWAEVRAGSPVSAAPTTPLSDFAKCLRSSAMCHLRHVTRARDRNNFAGRGADRHNDGRTLAYLVRLNAPLSRPVLGTR